ncbi:MAG: hypothetical protein Kow00109_27110 [Acidobacteriota bacterium]
MRIWKELQELPVAVWQWVGLAAVWCLLFTGPLIRLARLGLHNDDYSHVGLIPFLFLFALWRQRTEILPAIQPNDRMAPVLGLMTVALAVAAFVWQGPTAEIDRLSLAIGVFVLGLAASFVWRLGTKAWRKAAFPFFLLLFFIPLPTFVLHRWVEALLWGSAHTTDFFFHLTGVPYLRDGSHFYLANLAIEIAEQCSGIRSTMALMITGLLAGWLYLRRFWSRGLLILLLFPLAVFKNGLRITTLTLLSIHVDPEFLEGDLHRKGGIVFFLVTLAVMAGILWVLQKAEERRAVGPGSRDKMKPETTGEHP